LRFEFRESLNFEEAIHSQVTHHEEKRNFKFFHGRIDKLRHRLRLMAVYGSVEGGKKERKD